MRADRLDRVGLVGALVVAVAQDPGEAERDATGVAGRALEAVEGDLHHLQRPQLHDVGVADGRGGDGELGEPLGLPREHLVGHALERLAEHDEAGLGRLVARAEVDVGQPPLAPPGPPLDGEDHQVESVPRLDLDPRRAARRSWPGESSRSRPSTCSRSKKWGVTATPESWAVRLAVSWKAIGRPSSARASASPSRTKHSAGRERATSTTSGSRAVMSSRLRVTTSTSSPSRWTWMRIPSSLASMATSVSPSGESPPIAAATSGALEASIGMIGRPTSSPMASSASSPANAA